MRTHFIECVMNGKLTPFPSEMIRRARLVRKEKVKLYCDCRQPENGKENMAYCATCKKWYHQTCQTIQYFHRPSHKTGFVTIV